MAPLRVAGLIEFHVFETEPLKLRTYCILPSWVKRPRTRMCTDTQTPKYVKECNIWGRRGKERLERGEEAEEKKDSGNWRNRRRQTAHVTLS